MYTRVGRVAPIVRAAAVSYKCVPRRSLWDFPRLPGLGLRAAMRELDKISHLEREFFNHTPMLTQISPRLVPIHAGDTEFRLNIDVEGFNPEEVSVNVSDNILTVKGKMERTGEDGSKFHQEFTRQMSLPDNIVTKALKSYLNPSGMLVIEAPLDVKVNEIPIKHIQAGEKVEEKK